MDSRSVARPRVACRNPPVGTERWSFDDPVAKLPRLYVEGEAATLRAEHLLGAGSTRSERTAAVGSAAEQRGRVCKRARLSSRLWTANEGSDSGVGLLTLLEARGRRDAHSRGPSCSSRARVSMSIQSVTGRFRTRRMRPRRWPRGRSAQRCPSPSRRRRPGAERGGLRGSRTVPTHPDGPRRKVWRLIAVAQFRAGMRWTAVGCVGPGADYESVALPLSYPGSRR